MADGMPAGESVRVAELIASLSLATDLAVGLPLEHGLESTLFARRLGERLGIDDATASDTYYACLLFYVGCTADAHLLGELFDDGMHQQHLLPVMFGSRREMMVGLIRALTPRDGAPPQRALAAVRKLPRAASVHQEHLAALCEVGEMLADRLGLPPSVQRLMAVLPERWDGKGAPGQARGEQVPLPVRIVQVARDAAFHRMLGGPEAAARIVHERAGHAFDPAIAALLVEEAADILALDASRSAWEQVLECEPRPWLTLEGDAIDHALAAMGDFADLASPFLTGHSSGVAELAGAAAECCDWEPSAATGIRRAAHVHDLGRAGVPVRVWQKRGPLTPDEWEGVRLHAYHSERLLTRSPFLAGLAPAAAAHHERLDGSGYHRGSSAPSLDQRARMIAAADAYRAMTEPRPHREALNPERAAAVLTDEANAGRLDADAVGAVLEAAGQPVPRLERPAGLTEREVQVVGLLARGQQTKQVARTLGISVKTADRHIQNAYAKIGVSTRASAALFAMEHGLVAWGELPIPAASRSA